MDAELILKAILNKSDSISITESDLIKSKEQSIGMIEMFDDDGEKKYMIYTHKKRKGSAL